MLFHKELPLEQLNHVIADKAVHIHDYSKSKSDFTRKRKLDAETLIKVTLNMQGNSLNAELFDAFPDIQQRMTASAYEQAKAKVSPNIFKDIFDDYNRTMTFPKRLCARKHYRVYAVDGCDFNIPYSKNSEFTVDRSEWKNSKSDEPMKPFSMIHANMMFDLMNRTYQDCILQPRSKANERDAAIDMIKRIDNQTPFIVIMDRGYSAFNVFENCNRINNCYYIIRTNIGSAAK